MESDLAVSLLKNTNSEYHHVSTIIGDDDTTTMSKVQKQIPFEVKKQSDINHAKKSLGNDLYNLQKTHKILQAKVITYLQKCFSYAIMQNENDHEKHEMLSYPSFHMFLGSMIAAELGANFHRTQNEVIKIFRIRNALVVVSYAKL